MGYKVTKNSLEIGAQRYGRKKALTVGPTTLTVFHLLSALSNRESKLTPAEKDRTDERFEEIQRLK